MNRTARIGALISTVAMSVGLGVTSAAPAVAQDGIRTATASPVAEFFRPGAKVPGNLFKPGAKLTIKRNTDYVRSLSTVPAKPQDRIDLGESCGTDVISKSDGPGPTTLIVSVNKEHSVQLMGDAGISKSAISASVGFSVTDTYRVTNETRYEVPKNKHGYVEAYPLFEHYRVMVWTRAIEVFKPIGVCFNSWVD
ncbi:hypothetical protein ACWD4N_31575 [Streptomyces sp. NPDC002586]